MEARHGYDGPECYRADHVTYDGPDGTAIRHVRSWAVNKWDILDRVTQISTVGMRYKFDNLVLL